MVKVTPIITTEYHKCK